MSSDLISKLKDFLFINETEFSYSFEGDENPPAFYDPEQVIRLIQMLRKFSIIALVIINLLSIPQIGQMQKIVLSFFNNQPEYQNLTWLITALISVIGILVQSFLYFFSLRAISSILQILMDIEFNSRNQGSINIT